jgi:hypothetical protein
MILYILILFIIIIIVIFSCAHVLVLDRYLARERLVVGGGGGEITRPIGGVRQSRELSLRLPAGGCSILPLPPREQVQSFIIYSRRLCVCIFVCTYTSMCVCIVHFLGYDADTSLYISLVYLCTS